MKNVQNKKQNINKKEFISKLMKKQNLSLEQTEIGLNGILDFLSYCLKENSTIEIRGFGKFQSKNGKKSFLSFIKYF
jgi:nucleoid DNA-binding protein